MWTQVCIQTAIVGCIKVLQTYRVLHGYGIRGAEPFFGGDENLREIFVE